MENVLISYYLAGDNLSFYKRNNAEKTKKEHGGSDFSNIYCFNYKIKETKINFAYFLLQNL